MERRLVLIAFVVVATFGTETAYALNFKHMGSGNTSLREIESRIRANPNSTSAYCERAEAYLMEGDRDMAMLDLNKALSIDPHCARALIGRSQSYELVNKFDLALKDADAAILTNDQGFLGDAILQKISIYKTLKRTNDLLPLYQRLIDLQGLKSRDRYDLLEERAGLYLKQRKAKLALADLTLLQQDHARTHVLRAWLRGQAYEMLNDNGKALQAYSAGIAESKNVVKRMNRIDPGVQKCYFARAKLFEKLGQPEKAAADMNAAKQVEAQYVELSPFRMK